MPDGVVGVEEVGEGFFFDEFDAFNEFRFVDAAVFDVFLDDVGFDAGANEVLHVFVQLGRVGEGDATDGYAAGVLASDGVGDGVGA